MRLLNLCTERKLSSSLLAQSVDEATRYTVGELKFKLKEIIRYSACSFHKLVGWLFGLRVCLIYLLSCFENQLSNIEHCEVLPTAWPAIFYVEPCRWKIYSVLN